jgi:predicted pyridoxine 5'-phosphate oxidase superfamily flavin-nucleotide-binding protein
MAKKKTVIKKGIHLHESSKGFSVHIHSANGNKLAVLTGYNTRQNALKGVRALHIAIEGAHDIHGKYGHTDHTVVAKKAAKKAATKHVTSIR